MNNQPAIASLRAIVIHGRMIGRGREMIVIMIWFLSVAQLAIVAVEGSLPLWHTSYVAQHSDCGAFLF
jgi:hypothetical protein